MALRTRDDLITDFKAIAGESANSDSAIKFLEDLTDTVNPLLGKQITDLESEVNRLKEEKEKLDSDWRQRYTDRFSGMQDNSPKIEETPPANDPAKELTFEALFTTN